MKLKPHQKIVVDHLRHNRAIICCFSTGSGKTLTAVAAMCAWLKTDATHRALFVAPTSLVDNFKKEINQYDPALASQFAPKIRIVTYQGFVNSPTRCGPNLMLILDEAHNRRNADGAITRELIKCARQAGRVLLLTATPMVNGVADLVPLVLMARPEALSGADGVVPNSINLLGKMLVSPQFLKKNGKHLFTFFTPNPAQTKQFYPTSHIHEVFIPMPPSYEQKYILVEKDQLSRLRGASELFAGTPRDTNINVFYNGVRRAVNALEGINSPKIVWVRKLLQSKRPTDRVVIFSNFRAAGVELIIQILEKTRIAWREINGSIGAPERKVAVDMYNKGEITVLLITRAGGEGLDLKCTRYIIALEPGWNETQFQQVSGRAIRYKSHASCPAGGRTVDVYRLYLVRQAEYRRRNVLAKQIANIAEVSPPLSVDFYLRNYSLHKQTEINKYLGELRKIAVESKKRN